MLRKNLVKSRGKAASNGGMKAFVERDGSLYCAHTRCGYRFGTKDSAMAGMTIHPACRHTQGGELPDCPIKELVELKERLER